MAITAAQSYAIEMLHNAFVRVQVAKGVDGPVPEGRPVPSDYNQHVPDLESSGNDWDAYDAEVRKILGLAPLEPVPEPEPAL